MIELKTCLEPTDINRFGAYLNHLAILSEDPTVKSTNRQKLKGYLLQWRSAKMLFGCALFHDLLKPATILCKVLQDNEVCIVGAIEAILKTSRAIEKLTATSLNDLPTVEKVSSRIEHSEGGTPTYQGAELTKHEEGVAYLKSHKDQYMTSIQAYLKDRVKAQNTDLLT